MASRNNLDEVHKFRTVSAEGTLLQYSENKNQRDLWAVHFRAEEVVAIQVAKSVEELEAARTTDATDVSGESGPSKMYLFASANGGHAGGGHRDLLDVHSASNSFGAIATEFEQSRDLLQIDSQVNNYASAQDATEVAGAVERDIIQGRAKLSFTSAAIFAFGMTLSLLISALATRRYLIQNRS